MEDTVRYVNLGFEWFLGPAMACQRCGAIVAMGSIELHDRWHERIDLIAVQVDEIDQWMAVRSS
jgi:hypothetical protein